ncbi:MAG: hypothetical protein HQK49_04335 [Oligoflexia bacterium]|nr:hypothetical protein [Oligoflexia bacterium]
MVENSYLILILIIYFSFTSILKAENYNESYYWYDGNEKKIIYLKDNLLAAFPNNNSTSSTSRMKTTANTKIVNGYGHGYGSKKTIIYRVNKNVNVKSLIAESVPRSPVFAPSVQDMSSLLSLPGGIIITFSNDFLPEDVQKWAVSNSLTNGRKLTFKKKNIWAFDCEPGLFGLKKANELMESKSNSNSNSKAMNSKIISAQPNWWRMVEKK